MIYFAQVGDDGPIKIGFSRNAEKRVADISLTQPFPVTTLAIIPGEVADEFALHKKLAAHRLKGEWFSPHPDVLAEVGRAKNAPSHEDRIATKETYHIFAVKMFPQVLRVAFETASSMKNVLAEAAEITPATAKRWLQGGGFPQIAPMLRLARNNKTVRAWFLTFSVAMEIADAEGVPIEEAFEKAAGNPQMVLDAWKESA